MKKMSLDIQMFAEGNTTVTIGQYSISECTFKVKKDNEYVSISDMEEVNLTIENNVETWHSMTDGGWQNALLTAKALTGSFNGKRCYGDAGNDYLDSLRLNIGRSAEADFQVGFPNGATLEFSSVVALTDILGSATSVGPLAGDLTGKGKPKFTPGTDN